MLHGAMHYQCKDCGLRWRMWLEVGVEGKDKKQPCPFSIPCECGGVAQHVDWQKDHFLSAPRPAYPGMNYFALDRGGKKEMACGKPMVYVGDE